MGRTKSKTPFFQEILDALAANNHPDLVLLKDLSEAVDAGNRKAVTPLVRALRGRDLDEPPLNAISSRFFYELMSRILLLGWHSEFETMMSWYRESLLARDEIAAIDNWEGVLKAIPSPPAALPSDEAIAQWTSFTFALDGVLRALSKLDRPSRRPFLPDSGEELGFGTRTPRKRSLMQVLEDGVEQLVRALQMLFQQLLERAVLEVESSNTGERLLQLDKMQAALVDLLNSYEKSTQIGFLRVRLTEILHGSGKVHHYLDAFPPNKARRIPFLAYDRDLRHKPADKPGWLSEVIRTRNRQLLFYMNAYGERRDAAGGFTPESRPRRRLITRHFSNHLKLRTDEDLVKFLVALVDETFQATLRDVKGASAEDAVNKAWDTVISFLADYVKNLTFHTTFNLSEQEPNYLLRTYPRALSGGALHDCGVYAVRIAFILLSLSEQLERRKDIFLGLNLSFVILPLHVGLIIESDTVGLVVTHNDVFFQVGDALKGFEAAWLDRPLPEDPDPPDSQQLLAKIKEDLAAALFIRDVDMPVIRREVLPEGTAVTAKSVWSSYQRNVADMYSKLFSNRVSVRGTDEYQLDVRYLEALHIENIWENEYVVPFWNFRCKEIWKSHREALQKDLGAAAPAYVLELKKEISAVENQYFKDVLPFKREVTKVLRKNPKGTLGKDVRPVFSFRLAAQTRAVIGPIGRVLQHIFEVEAAAQAPAGVLIPPPFADPAQDLTLRPV